MDSEIYLKIAELEVSGQVQRRELNLLSFVMHSQANQEVLQEISKRYHMSIVPLEIRRKKTFEVERTIPAVLFEAYYQSVDQQNAFIVSARVDDQISGDEIHSLAKVIVHGNNIHGDIPIQGLRISGIEFDNYDNITAVEDKVLAIADNLKIASAKPGTVMRGQFPFLEEPHGFFYRFNENRTTYFDVALLYGGGDFGTMPLDRDQTLVSHPKPTKLVGYYPEKA